MSSIDVVLASGSPRRRELLGALGLRYRVVPADVDESPRPNERPVALALRLASAKASHVARLEPANTVIAADTVVALGRLLYAKPTDAVDAARMLRELSDRRHRVITGVVVAKGDRLVSLAVVSMVRLKRFDEVWIDAYVTSGDPLDKAGAYAIQNTDFRPVERVTGCVCNVVGLPLGPTGDLLARAGVTSPVSPAEACPFRSFSARRCLKIVD